MAGKKNPNLGDKLRQEREGAENTLRDSRNKATDSSTGDSQDAQQEAEIGAGGKGEEEECSRFREKGRKAKEAGESCGRCAFNQSTSECA